MVTEYKLDSQWILWYHNPYDCNWDKTSYTKIYQIDSVNNFWKLQNSMDNLPNINEAMYFITRIKDDNIIWPNWEDPYNINGGFLFFKVSEENNYEAWKYLNLYLFSNNITKKKEDIGSINGISISPKKCFSIIKIWNNDCNNSDNDILNPDIPYFDISEVVYKSHNTNIENDQKKKK